MTTPADDLPELIRALHDESAYDHRVESIALVETHISWVLLTGSFAYKIKKPVNFAFVDFSTLERRKAFCDEEIRLNRRLAPSIYLGVVPIGGSASRPVIGALPAIEYAVKMRQFPPAERLDRRLARGTVTERDLRELGARIGRFHASLEPAAETTRLGSLAIVIRTVLNNLHELEAVATDRDLAAIEPIRAWTETQCVTLNEAFARRKSQGAIRECHGDLHLENLVYLEGAIAAFDALEFDPELRWVDVMSEAGFLMMDLIAHDHGELAYSFANRYFETTGDYSGLEVLTFYIVYRALVRAKVAALRERQSTSQAEAPRPAYIEHARRLCAPRRTLLLITHGLSGSGKTTLTDGLIGRLGAIRVRSDLERKRLHGIAENADSGSGIAAGLYSRASSEQTYAALARYAGCGLRAGIDMIVDAAFLHRAERDAFRALAERNRAAFVILDCTSPEAVLAERVRHRKAQRSDASEADESVLAHQLASHEPLVRDEADAAVRIDTSLSPDLAGIVDRISRLRAT
jgi:uncharacterized protein